jgi:hypothetical protein
VSADPDPRTGYERDDLQRDPFERGRGQRDPVERDHVERRDPASRPLGTPPAIPAGTDRILTWVSFALAVIALMAGWMAALIGLVLGLVAHNLGDRWLGRWAAIANGAAIVVLVLLSFMD